MTAPVTAGGIIAEPTAVPDEDALLILDAQKNAGNLASGTMFTGRARVSRCPNCSAKFVQWELSERFHQWVAAQRNEKNRSTWAEICTENALPLLCVLCERRDLGRGLEPPRPATAFGYGD